MSSGNVLVVRGVVESRVQVMLHRSPTFGLDGEFKMACPTTWFLSALT